MRLLWVSALIVIVDQLTKIWIRTTMYIGESIPLLGSWLRLTFTENPGMAFGLQLGSTPLITMFSMVATVLIIIYLWQMRDGPLGYRMSIAVVLGGAIGNIIDRVFYGELFSYGAYFGGHVVDFIHVDVWRGVVADWIPLIGGKAMALFPIWNVADMAIVLGVVGMLISQQSFKEESYEEESRTRERWAEEEAGTSESLPLDGDSSEVTPDNGSASDVSSQESEHRSWS